MGRYTQLTFAITADGDVRDVKFKYKKFSSTRFLILILRVLTPEYLLTDRRTRVTKFSTRVIKFKFSTDERRTVEHSRMLVPRVLYNWEKQNCGRTSSMPGRSPNFDFRRFGYGKAVTTSAIRTQSRPCTPFCQYYYFFFPRYSSTASKIT